MDGTAPTESVQLRQSSFREEDDGLRWNIGPRSESSFIEREEVKETESKKTIPVGKADQC